MEDQSPLIPRLTSLQVVRTSSPPHPSSDIEDSVQSIGISKCLMSSVTMTRQHCPRRTSQTTGASHVDWFSRVVLSWRIFNSLDGSFCREALNGAIDRYGRPEIFNTDQGSQFTADAFTSILSSHGIAISMDGRGRAIDNVFAERLWRSYKYEYLYLSCPTTAEELYRGTEKYLTDFNWSRPHSSLDGRSPGALYLPNSS